MLPVTEAASNPPHDVAHRDSNAVDTVAGTDPTTDAQRNGDSVDAAVAVANENDSGKLELGIEVFASESSSQGTRLLLEQRRARQQRRDRVIRWIWLMASILFLLLVLVILTLTLWRSGNNPPPNYAPAGPSRPEILPPRRESEADRISYGARERGRTFF